MKAPVMKSGLRFSSPTVLTADRILSNSAIVLQRGFVTFNIYVEFDNFVSPQIQNFYDGATAAQAAHTLLTELSRYVTLGHIYPSTYSRHPSLQRLNSNP